MAEAVTTVPPSADIEFGRQVCQKDFRASADAKMQNFFERVIEIKLEKIFYSGTGGMRWNDTMSTVGHHTGLIM